MGVSKRPLKPLKKHQQRPCPYEDQSDFCAGQCEDYYFCTLPKLVSKNEWRKRSKSESLTGYERAIRKMEEQAERDLRRSHVDRGFY